MAGEPLSIIILSSGNLFAEGVASRLQQYGREVQCTTINPQEYDYLAQIERNNPAAVVLNANEVSLQDRCLLCDLLNNCPDQDILRLSLDPQTVQVIRTRQYQLEKVHDLIDLIVNDRPEI